MPPLRPDFLRPELLRFEAPPPPAALTRAQRARAAAAILARPSGESPPRRFRLPRPALGADTVAAAALAILLAALEPPRRLFNRFCNWLICLFKPTASSSCFRDTSMAQL